MMWWEQLRVTALANAQVLGQVSEGVYLAGTGRAVLAE